MTLATQDVYVLPKSIPASQSESKRRFVVRVVYLIFFLSLIEGPLRKWFLPSLSGPLALLRDPFTLMLYVYCLKNGLFWKRGLPQIWLVFAYVSIVFALLQYLLNGHGVNGWILGVRTYWLYMPLAFIVARNFRIDDVLYFLRMVLTISVPYSVLVAVQYNSPYNAFINWGASGDEYAAVTLTDGIIRPFGLFTYLAPNTKYTAFTAAVFLSYYLARPANLSGSIFLVVTGIAVATMTVLTGSRAIYFVMGSVLFVTILGLLMARPSKRSLRLLVAVFGFVPFCGIVFVQIFPDMLAAMEVRFARASNAEGSIWNRVYYSGFSFLDGFLDAEFFGYGMGAGAPGVARFIGLPPLYLGEGDTLRNVRELGVLFGGAILLIRWITAGWILKKSFDLAWKRIPFCLPLAGFAAMQFAIAQLTNSPLSGYLPWLTFGLIAAVWNSSQEGN